MDNSNDLGYVPDANNQAAYNAAMRRLRTNYAARSGTLANNIAARGVRTSGVGTIPEAQLANQEGAQEAGVIGGLAENQGNQAFQDTEANKQQAWLQQNTRDQFGMMQAAQRRLAQGQLQGALISGGLSALGNVYQGAGA